MMVCDRVEYELFTLYRHKAITMETAREVGKAMYRGTIPNMHQAMDILQALAENQRSVNEDIRVLWTAKIN